MVRKAYLPKLNSAIVTLREKKGVHPENHEIAEFLGISTKEVELWQDHRKELIHSYLSLVKRMAKSCYYKNINRLGPYGFSSDDQDEYIAIANLVLMERLDQFKWDNGGDFSEELIGAIWSELSNYRTHNLVRKRVRAYSLNDTAIFTKSGDRTSELSDRTLDMKSPNPVEIVANHEEFSPQLISAIGQLPQSMQELLLWDLGLKHAKKSRDEISDLVGISQSELHVLVGAAKRRLAYLLTQKETVYL